MALVTPSRVTITDLNTELTIPASTRTNIGNTWVHNVAAIPPILISTDTLSSIIPRTATQQLTAPSGATFARLRLWGGGGGSSINSPYGAGGGSGFVLKFLDVVGGSTVATCVVGGIGIRGTPNGTDGGTTTVTINSVTYTATGGTGSTTGGFGGSGTNGDINESGGTGTSGARPTRGGNAGGLQYGGGLGGLGVAGQTPGGGGGSTTLAGIGNDGGDGRVIIDWYKSNIIKFSNLRWGINFPGVQLVGPRYRYSNTANIVSSRTRVASTGFVMANGRIEINSNGILKYIVGGREPGVNATSDLRSTTWLTSGVNSDYTANIVITGTGSFDADSSPTNADLLLNTTRRWTITNNQPAPGGTTRSASGVMIIKNDGVEIFRRPWTMSVTATFINLFV